MPDQNIIFRVHELHHALWHATDDQILTIELHGRFVECRRQRSISLKALPDFLHQCLFTERQQKFFHIHRIERFHIDLSDRKREFRAVHCDTEQTAGDDDVVIWSAFAEIFKRGQCSFTELHLVKYD